MLVHTCMGVGWFIFLNWLFDLKKINKKAKPMITTTANNNEPINYLTEKLAPEPSFTTVML